MTHSSDNFTRSLILSVSSRMKDRERYAAILNGSNGEASPEARESYFRYGSALFTIVGVTLLFFGCAAMVLTLIFHGPLGFGFFFYYAPGAMLTTTGYALGVWEKKAQDGENVKFTVIWLLGAWMVGSFMALVIATFSAVNAIASKM